MTTLTEARDHARRMADFRVSTQQSEACAGNHNPWTVTTWAEPDHEACRSARCFCPCHEPTPAARKLWTQIADEIDAYLAGPTEHEDLFGTTRPEPEETPAP